MGLGGLILFLYIVKIKFIYIMKNVITLLVIFLVVVSTNLQSQVVQFDSSDGHPAAVVMVERGHLPLEVLFYSEDGTLVFDDVIMKFSNLGKIYDLSQLPNGKYEIKLTTMYQHSVMDFYLQNNQVKTGKSETKFFAVPVIITGDRYFDIKFNSPKLANLKIELLTWDGNSVFKDEPTGVVSLSRRYKLSKLEQGKYMIKVSTEDYSYYNTIELQ